MKKFINYKNLTTKERVAALKIDRKRDINPPYFLYREVYSSNDLIKNKEYINIIENYLGEYKILLDIMNNFKIKISDLDLLKDKQMFVQLLEEFILIESLYYLYYIQVISNIGSEEDINYLDSFEIIQQIYLDNIEEVKERDILSYLNELDEIKKLFFEIKKSFFGYYFDKGKSVFIEFMKDSKSKNIKSKFNYDISEFTLLVFSSFAPNIDYKLNDNIVNVLSKIRKVKIQKPKEKKDQIMTLFPKMKNDLQYITNVKNINIFSEYDKILSEIDVDNIEENFKSKEFFNFVQKNINVGNNSIVFINDEMENLNISINIELKVESETNKKFTLRYMSMKVLILETRAKLYGIDIKKLSEFDIIKREVLKTKFNVDNKYIEKIVEKNLYFNIQDLYKNSIFIFKDYTYKEITSMFKQSNIIISSGANNVKELVNTLDLRLINFLKAIYDNSIVYEIVKNSYNRSKIKGINRSGIKDINGPYIDISKIEIHNFQLIFENNKLKSILKKEISTESSKDSKPSNLKSESFEFNKNLEHNGCILSSSNINNNNNKSCRNYSTIENLKNFKSYKENNIQNNENKNDFIMEIYSSIVNSQNLSKEEKQLKMESFWFDFQQYFKGLDENITKELPYILLNTVIKVNNTLQLKYKKNILKRKFPSIYLKLNKIELLLITIYLSVKFINMKQNNWTNVSSVVGKKILYHLYSEEIRSNVKKDLEIVYENYKNFTFDRFLEDRSIKDFNLYSIKLGDFFLELFCQEPHIILEKQYGYDDNKDLNLKVNIEASYLKHLSENILVDYASIPMICKPKLWDENNRGGYLLDDYINQSIITGSTNHGHKMNNKTILYDTINHLNQLEFSVNNDLLDYLLSSNGQNLLESNLNVTKSELIQIKTNIKLAQIFKNETFYLPLRGDFRGRLYVNSFFLNYQGSDLSKSLVNLAKGQILTKEGLEYLYIFGANLYNFNSINKDNHKNRIAWVTSNLDKIYDMDLNFIKKSENIWSFISFCLVMRRLKENSNYEVKLPIYIDATCSGIQHIAAMIKDYDIGKTVNLVTQLNEDKVNDIYTIILDIVNKEIQELGNKKDSEYPKFKHLILNRNDIKSPVMTKTYNVTLIGMKNQLVLSLGNRISSKNIELKNIKKNVVIESCLTNELIELESKDIIKIAQIIESKIFSSFPLLESVYNYFKKICKLMNNLGLPIIWFTPSGLEITQNYYKFKEIKVAISFAGKSKKLVLKD